MNMYQLEFDFVKEMDKCKSGRSIIDWAEEHVRPEFEWIADPYYKDENEGGGGSWSLERFKQQVKEHFMAGLSFKWKF